ncbi:putative O-methyltransferase YrrM [Geomicrobium halophilum]|uniref:tRNA 5-hydroxyuridine methyltransferase n=1 Tax=Geomicrobium halophilum TaxID=549000 RepID=A0A841PWA4_9BACL|nr:O-methyltransferase [Geomicrobium halophilum]MBB6448573.1 putative O-methyltransferase YrrM [Geomicrobium halophilum]
MKDRNLEYLQSLRKDTPILQVEKMRAYAEKENIPILEEESMELLLQVMDLVNAQHVLEIGSAIGYSALRIAASGNDRRVTTIERDADRYHQAESFLGGTCYNDDISLLYGDAFDFEKVLEEHKPYDALFIDASKGHNQAFVNTFSPMLKTGGVMVIDNVLFKGWVARPEEAPPRLQPLARKLRDFNEWLLEHPHFCTRIHPIGDGIAISIKR